MAPTPLTTKRINLEIVFWDLTILLITQIRNIVCLLPARLPINTRWFTSILPWMLWILAGFSAGWFTEVLSR